MEPRPWALSIDYGTSNTVSAIVEPRRAPRMLQFNGSVSLPSAVYFDPESDRMWRVGKAAQQAGLDDPGNYEPTPKRAIPMGDVFLGGRVVAVQELICATLTEVFREAWRQQDGMPPHLVLLTHPAAWPRASLDVLVAAARQALPGNGKNVPVMTTPEPVAAAWHASNSRRVPPQARIAVLDLGGGTCDIAVVDRHDRNYTLASRPLGADPLGGEDFDVRLLEAVLDDLGQPDLHNRLINGNEHERAAYLDLRRACREAKEQLSEEVRTTVRVPVIRELVPEGASVQVSRPHRLEPLLLSGGPERPGLDTAADLTSAGLREAPATPNPTFVFLVGGSSRIPLLGRLVQERTGLEPLEHGDPGTAVAEGAASIAAGALAGRNVPVANPKDPKLSVGRIQRNAGTGPPAHPSHPAHSRAAGPARPPGPPRQAGQLRPAAQLGHAPGYPAGPQVGPRPASGPIQQPHGPVPHGPRPVAGPHPVPPPVGHRPVSGPIPQPAAHQAPNGYRPPPAPRASGQQPTVGTGLAIGILLGLLILLLLGVFLVLNQGSGSSLGPSQPTTTVSTAAGGQDGGGAAPVI